MIKSERMIFTTKDMLEEAKAGLRNDFIFYKKAFNVLSRNKKKKLANKVRGLMDLAEWQYNHIFVIPPPR